MQDLFKFLSVHTGMSDEFWGLLTVAWVDVCDEVLCKSDAFFREFFATS